MNTIDPIGFGSSSSSTAKLFSSTSSLPPPEKETRTKSNSSSTSTKLPTPVTLPDHRFDSIEAWKKARGVDPTTPVFQIRGALPSIRKALIERGWAENEDPNSPFWDFKYAYQKKHLNIDLCEGKNDARVVNFFARNDEFTTKRKLCINMENLVFLEDKTADDLVPRTYDLSIAGEVDAFTEHFKTNHCASIIMGHVRRRGNNSFAENILQVAESVLQKKNKHMDDILDEEEGTDLNKISAEDWAVLERVSLEKPTKQLPVYSRSKTNKQRKRRKKKKINEEDNGEEEDVSPTREDQNPIKKTLDDWLEHHPGQQETLVGEHNLWIMKPASLSRGRGIFVTNRLEEALECVKSGMWMAQKYIERPLIIEGKKFDIRQWVLITSWQPMGVWVYKDSYLRFSFDDYDSTDSKNRYAHLTNYSISYHAKNFEERRDETMMHSNDFQQFLKDTNDGEDVWTNHIQPAMKEAVYMSLSSCQETQTNARENSFELVGFDFMVDTSNNVWLLECNSSPDLSYSTQVTKELVQQLLPDMVKVVVDCERMGNLGGKKPSWSKKYVAEMDPGRWELLEPVRRRKEMRAGVKNRDKGISNSALTLVGAPAHIHKQKRKAREDTLLALSSPQRSPKTNISSCSSRAPVDSGPALSPVSVVATIPSSRMCIEGTCADYRLDDHDPDQDDDRDDLQSECTTALNSAPDIGELDELIIGNAAAIRTLSGSNPDTSPITASNLLPNPDVRPLSELLPTTMALLDRTQPLPTPTPIMTSSRTYGSNPAGSPVRKFSFPPPERPADAHGRESVQGARLQRRPNRSNLPSARTGGSDADSTTAQSDDRTESARESRQPTKWSTSTEGTSATRPSSSSSTRHIARRKSGTNVLRRKLELSVAAEAGSRLMSESNIGSSRDTRHTPANIGTATGRKLLSMTTFQMDF